MNDQLIPAIIQDCKTGEVLMLAYMNEESYKLTMETGYTWFFSRSRQKLWNKGETSGNKQAVKEIRYDCDEDTYLVLVEQIGDAACHTGNRSCFYRQSHPNEKDVHDAPPVFSCCETGIFEELQQVLDRRRVDSPKGSYTAELFLAGQERILAKIAEESAEVIEAARHESDDRLVAEVSDLVFHILVLLSSKGLSIDQVKAELSSRRK